jgi:hypothetical protein
MGRQPRRRLREHSKRRCNAVTGSVVVGTSRFVQRPRGSIFRTTDHATLLGIVVPCDAMMRQALFHGSRLDGVRDLMSEPERGRLRATASCSQRRIRVPSDRVRLWIEMIVVSPVERQSVPAVIRMFQSEEQRAFAGIATEIPFGFVVQARLIAREGQRPSVDSR